MPITFHKEDGAAVAVPDADNKVTFFVDETGNPAVKHADGSSSKVLIDGDAFTTSDKPVLTYVANGYEGTDITVLIANYEDYMSGVEFGVKPQGGIAVLTGGTIIWSLPQMDVAGPVTLDVTAREFGKATSTSTATVNVDLIPFNTDGLDIISPTEGAVDVKETAPVTAGTPSASDPAYNHVSTSWYVSPDGSKVNAVAKSIDDTINLNSWTIAKGMAEGTDYKLWREIKMSNGEQVFTLISDKVSFTSADTFNPWPELDITLSGLLQQLNTVEGNYVTVSAADSQNVLIGYQGDSSSLHFLSGQRAEGANTMAFSNVTPLQAGSSDNIESVCLDELHGAFTYWKDMALRIAAVGRASSGANSWAVDYDSELITTSGIQGPHHTFKVDELSFMLIYCTLTETRCAYVTKSTVGGTYSVVSDIQIMNSSTTTFSGVALNPENAVVFLKQSSSTGPGTAGTPFVIHLQRALGGTSWTPGDPSPIAGAINPAFVAACKISETEAGFWFHDNPGERGLFIVGTKDSATATSFTFGDPAYYKPAENRVGYVGEAVSPNPDTVAAATWIAVDHRSIIVFTRPASGTVWEEHPHVIVYPDSYTTTFDMDMLDENALVIIDRDATTNFKYSRIIVAG